MSYPPLVQASLDGNLEKVKKLLEEGADPNSASYYSESATFMATKEGHTEVVKVLLEKGADPNKKLSTDGQTPLIQAAMLNYVEIIKLLLKHGADPNIVLTTDNQTPLYQATNVGHLEAARLLLEAKADPNIQLSTDGQSPVFTPSMFGNLPMVKLLLDHGANPDLCLKTDGQTPLYQASLNGHLEVVRHLLDAKGNPNLQLTTDGQAPIFPSALNGNTDVVRLLIEKGANFNITTNNGETPLYAAAWNGHAATMKVLLDANADVNIAIYTGDAPLYPAVKNNHIDCVKQLLAAKSDLKPKLLNVALQFNPTSDIANLLIEAGVQRNFADPSGRTSHYFSAIYGHPNVWSLLGNIDVNIETKASKKGHLKQHDGYKNESSGYKRVVPEQDILTNYHVVVDEWLGHGAFGDVFRGIMGKTTVAVKFLQKASDDDVKELLEETSLLGALQHINVIQHKTFIHEIPAIIMEYAENGNLNELLKTQSKQVDAGLRIKWAMQITNALLTLHSLGIVHRDLRCVNVLVSGNLDLKLADFGVSLWVDSNNETKKKPFYKGDKGIYEVKDAQHSYTYNFDIRLFGIVLAKLLSYGENVERELYDWKSNGLSEDLECDKESYLQLVKLCFNQSATTAFIAGFVRSIALHEFVDLKGVNLKDHDDGSWRRKVDESGILQIQEFRVKSEGNAAYLCNFLTERVEKESLQRHAIATVATIPPSDLNAKSKIFLETLAKLEKEKSTLSSGEEESLDTLLGKFGKFKYTSHVVDALKQVAKKDWSDTRIKAHLFKHLDSKNRYQWEYRHASAQCIRAMPDRDEATLKDLLRIWSIEIHPKVRMELALTIAELNWKDPRLVNLLSEALDKDQDSNVRRRAALALGKLGIEDEELKKKAVTFLCTGVDQLPSEEKRAVAEALGILKMIEEPEVAMTILKLLEDENDQVKKEAGKALSVLNS